MNDIILWGTVGLCGLIMLIYYFKNKKKLRCLLFGTLSGAIALIVVHYLGTYLGELVPLSGLSIAVSLILGIPGVVMLIVINLLQ